jgi:hypothetical protein
VPKRIIIIIFFTLENFSKPWGGGGGCVCEEDTARSLTAPPPVARPSALEGPPATPRHPAGRFPNLHRGPGLGWTRSAHARPVALVPRAGEYS